MHGSEQSPVCGYCNCTLSAPCYQPLISCPLPHSPPTPPCVVASGREIWNLTVEPNSNYAKVSWTHNFPAGSSDFVLEFTLDSKKSDQAHTELLKPKAWPECTYYRLKVQAWWYHVVIPGVTKYKGVGGAGGCYFQRAGETSPNFKKPFVHYRYVYNSAWWQRIKTWRVPTLKCSSVFSNETLKNIQVSLWMDTPSGELPVLLLHLHCSLGV